MGSPPYIINFRTEGSCFYQGNGKLVDTGTGLMGFQSSARHHRPAILLGLLELGKSWQYTYMWKSIVA